MKKVLILMIAFMFLGSILILQADTTDTSGHKCKTPCKTKVVKCPVSGKVIAKDAMNIKTEYKGKTFYFCCEGCKAKFDKDPEKYVKPCSHKDVYYCAKEGCKYKSDKPGKCPHCGVELKKHECKIEYVCPMEKCDYKSDKPGKCPKCSMELKKTECVCHTTTKTKCGDKKKDEKEKK